MTFKTTRYAYDFLAIGAIVFQRFLVMINAGFKWNDSSYFFCSLTSDFNHLVRFTRCISEHRSQKLSPHSKHRIVASGAIPESYSLSTLHMSHISDVVSCLLNIFVTSKRSCILDKEIFLNTTQTIFRNGELFSTQRTRHLLSWFTLCSLHHLCKAFKTERVNTG